ncbi:MAG: hypothetical protein ACREBE_03295, partial [bacterium]
RVIARHYLWGRAAHSAGGRFVNTLVGGSMRSRQAIAIAHRMWRDAGGSSVAREQRFERATGPEARACADPGRGE